MKKWLRVFGKEATKMKRMAIIVMTALGIPW